MLNVVQRRSFAVLLFVYFHLTYQQEEELYALRIPHTQGDEGVVSPMRDNSVGGFHTSRIASPAPLPKDHISSHPQRHSSPGGQSSITSAQLTHMTAVERSKKLRVARMNPHLQVTLFVLLVNFASLSSTVHGWPSSKVRTHLCLSRK